MRKENKKSSDVVTGQWLTDRKKLFEVTANNTPGSNVTFFEEGDQFDPHKPGLTVSKRYVGVNIQMKNPDDFQGFWDNFNKTKNTAQNAKDTP